MRDPITNRDLRKSEERILSEYDETQAFLWHNANPYGRITGDCVIRAISTASGLPYNVVFDGLVEVQHKTGFHITDDRCYSKYLDKIGFVPLHQPKTSSGKALSVTEYCDLLSHSRLNSVQSVVAHIGTPHLTCIMSVDRDNGESPRFKVLDTWNCESRRVGKVWVLYK